MVHYHQSSKLTCTGKSQNSRNHGWSKFFHCCWKDPDPYKLFWIRISHAQKHTDPSDPEHWLYHKWIRIPNLDRIPVRHHFYNPFLCKSSLFKSSVLYLSYFSFLVWPSVMCCLHLRLILSSFKWVWHYLEDILRVLHTVKNLLPHMTFVSL